ncbi:hypothetical protein BMI91_03885 [Thioclava sediminum]|uniref:Uncharacterized protein n=1 Tax=Thioclava sediminum TaxID=1915319 RepID=A0ABX3N0T1_9RHOB|nr:hypothetical protein [Thioclava sediminum]OOY25557.1 hypothetical protein BMI91_03885 [Thioclava sediminum]
MKTMVESMLQPQDIMRIGTFVQTAAHIELVLLHAVALMENTDLDTAAAKEDFVELKQSTWKLVARFAENAKEVPGHIGSEITRLAKEIREGLEFRHMVVHGAFSRERTDLDSLEVEHFLQRGARREREHFAVVEPITGEMLNEAIATADLILFELVALRSWLLRERSNESASN